MKNDTKKRHHLWAKGWRGKDGTQKFHPYTLVGFKFESERDVKK